ncbi:hypothetical protein L1987_67048 [Smallanthus sonchifolius]|uniref:Uncharacterized protein n=1 Tax=Smallanthus sonchifolius TaxID=185202 RepID=A0ACB9BYT5_9ASTR|nr:hypothetical protein L1987_67048 [Smallanthus sonchifolius]
MVKFAPDDVFDVPQIDVVAPGDVFDLPQVDVALGDVFVLQQIDVVAHDVHIQNQNQNIKNHTVGYTAPVPFPRLQLVNSSPFHTFSHSIIFIRFTVYNKERFEK